MVLFGLGKKKKNIEDVLDEVNPKMFPEEVGEVKEIPLTVKQEVCEGYPQVFIDEAKFRPKLKDFTKKVEFVSTYMYIRNKSHIKLENNNLHVFWQPREKTYRGYSRPQILFTQYKYSLKKKFLLDKLKNSQEDIFVNGFLFPQKISQEDQIPYFLPLVIHPVKISEYDDPVINSMKYFGPSTPSKKQLKLMVDEYGHDNIYNLYKTLEIDLTEVDK